MSQLSKRKIFLIQTVENSSENNNYHCGLFHLRLTANSTGILYLVKMAPPSSFHELLYYLVDRWINVVHFLIN